MNKVLKGDSGEQGLRFNQAYTLPFSLVSEDEEEITLSESEVRGIIIAKVDELIAEGQLFDVLGAPFDVFVEEV